MKTINNFIFLLLLSLIWACQDKEETPLKNVGYLQLEVAANSSVNTKAESIYDPKQIAVKIVDTHGATIKQTDDWEIWSSTNLELPVGEYTILASSNGFDGKTAAFDKPYYAGSTTIQIENGKTLAANVVCTLANVKVSVSFSEAFRNAFKAGTVQIGTEGGTFLSFLTSDNLADKYAYFPVEPLLWSITVRNKNDVSKTMENKIEDVKARDFYKFNFTIASSSNITISVDESTKDYSYTVGIPTTLPKLVLTTNLVNAWGRFAVLYGQLTTQADVNAEQFRFKYKKAADGDDAWQYVQADDVKTEVSTYTASAKITGLTPNTSYDFALCYDDGSLAGEGNILPFVTEEEIPLHNGNFDVWNKNGNTWFAGTTDEARTKNSFWDSGNIGTSTGLAGFNPKNPTSPEGTIVHTSGGKSGKLASQFVGLGSAGQFAAGNIYTGHFVKVIGTSGAEIQFGQPFISRPVQLRGWFRYTSGTVDYVGAIPAEVSVKKGDTDTNSIYIALSDKGSPYTINTSEKKFINYNTDPNIIAYGELPLSECVSTNGEWKEFTINLKYRSLSRKPTHIIICASASRYGDYFTGSSGSVLYVDDFELIYGGEPELEIKNK